MRKLGIFPSSCIRCQSITCKSLHFAMFPFRTVHRKPLDLFDEKRHWEGWVYCLIMQTTQLNDPIVRLRFDLLTSLFRCCIKVSAPDCISRSLGEPQSGPPCCSFWARIWVPSVYKANFITFLGGGRGTNISNTPNQFNVRKYAKSVMEIKFTRLNVTISVSSVLETCFNCFIVFHY